MSEGRALVNPQAIGFGARPLAMPGGGNVLCASALFPFRLADGAPVKPADWYEAVTVHAGTVTAPDSMVPLPQAEVLVLGALPPPVEDAREASLRCGGLVCRFILRPDPEAPTAPLTPGPQAAAWHERDNPVGRGGPGDQRVPLIIDAEQPQRPLWLGATPMDHPVRLRRMGVPDESSGTGWPADADPALMYEAHEKLWTRSLHPGDPLTLTGLLAEDMDLLLPPYRVTIASSRSPQGRWSLETVRIHCLMLIPAAGLAALAWRTSISIGDDVLGQSVLALVAALEDLDAAKRDEQDLAEIAVDRWLDPARALDDRPLLPAAMAATVETPFGAPPEGDPIVARQAAADAWMRAEMGMEDANPFGDAAPEPAGAVEEAQQAIAGDEPPDANAVGAVATTALAAAKRRHEEAGFPAPDAEAEREPERRGAGLDAEVARRLAGPYRAPQELTIAEQIRTNAIESVDADEVLAKLADARSQNANPPLFWPALEEAEAMRFGEQLCERLRSGDLGRHLDVSGVMVAAAVGAAAGGEPADSRPAIHGRRLDGLLAEESTWRNVEFADCEFVGGSFAGGRFEFCDFRGCVFDAVNLSRATIADCRFRDCEFRNLRAVSPVWTDCAFEACRFAELSLSDAALRDLEFVAGGWCDVQLDQGLLVQVVWRDIDLQQVTFSLTHAPNSRFERVSMFKLWAMGKGFPGSVFTEVQASTCGFLSACHFDEAQFERCRFLESGFTNAVFTDAGFDPGCRFDACDLTGAVFQNAELAEVRFLNCPMATSVWSNSNAVGAWFFGSSLRGVDFADTRLAGAVFADADVEGAKFEEREIIGADFRGTKRSSA